MEDTSVKRYSSTFVVGMCIVDKAGREVERKASMFEVPNVSNVVDIHLSSTLIAAAAADAAIVLAFRCNGLGVMRCLKTFGVWCCFVGF